MILYGLLNTKLSDMSDKVVVTIPEKFYAKLYRLRIVEQKRFVVGGAKYTEKARAGNGILRTRSSIVSIRYGMWECRKNWTN